jgi:hypothetical protein
MEGVTMIISSLLELAAVVFLIWGFCNEEKFVNFEKKIYKIWRSEK